MRKLLILLVALLASPVSATSFLDGADLPSPSDAFDALRSAAAALRDHGPGWVSARTYGAKCDGVADDTMAIVAALEAAAGVPAGTWATGGDPLLTPPAAQRRPVYLPPGTCIVTAPIPIRYANVSIVGDSTARLGGTFWNGWTAQIIADHDGDVFALNAQYNVSGFSISHVKIIKRDPHRGLGDGISVIGSGWQRGVALDSVTIQHVRDGVHIDGAAGSIANVTIRNSVLNACWRYGLYSEAALTISRIEASGITQNGVGGIYVAAKGLAVIDTDVEGQPAPITITGTNNTAIRIEGCYFEGNVAPDGTGLVTLRLTHGAVIRANQWGPNLTGPRLLVTDSSRIVTDVEIAPLNSANVISDGGFYALAGESVVANAGAGGQLAGDVSSMLGFTDWGVPGPTSMRCGSGIQPALLIASYRDIITGPWLSAPLLSGDLVAVSYAIRYTGSLPVASTQALVYGHNSATGVWDSLAGAGFDPKTDAGTLMGDLLVYWAAVQVPGTGQSYDRLRLYVYPYGHDGSATGSGAYVSRVISYQVTPGTIHRPALPCLYGP